MNKNMAKEDFNYKDYEFKNIINSIVLSSICSSSNYINKFTIPTSSFSINSNFAEDYNIIR